MSTLGQQELRVCPGCDTSNTFNTISKQEYRCGQCNLELAYLDLTANGVIRGIFGWLRTKGELIEGRYRVKSVLGKGGFGTTYLVEDLRLNGKRRALKEVPELLFDEYETKLLSRLRHPSIPDIIDRNVVDNMVYLVLEFGGNQTLGGERKRHQGRIPQTILIPWMRQLCEVLIYLHSQDPPVIHRDLKPDNILLDETGRIMLIDFGIAKESEPTAMTRTLGRAASYGFSPPEQAMGTGTDQRSDIYALGATFYTLLTGEKPPAAHERVAGKEIVTPSQIIPEVSPRLDDAILKALNLNVNHRQQTVKEFSQVLEAIDSGVQNSTRTTEYADRTVLLGSTNRTSGTHPSSIKLASGRITSVKSAAISDSAVPQTSKRNVIILIAAIAIGLVAMLVTGYLFWPKTDPEPPSLVKDGTTSKKSIGESKPEIPIAGEPKPEINATPVASPVVPGTGAAEKALIARKREPGVPVTSPTEAEAKRIAAQKAEERRQAKAKRIAARNAEERRRHAEAEREAEERRNAEVKHEAKHKAEREAEERRQAEAMRIAARNAEARRRQAEAKRIAAQIAEEQRGRNEVSRPRQPPSSKSNDTMIRLRNKWLNP